MRPHKATQNWSRNQAQTNTMSRVKTMSHSECELLVRRSPSVITLEPWEVSLAQFLGNLRQGLSSANGARDPKQAQEDPYFIHVLGVGGELAFARMRNLYPLLNFLPTKGGADTFARDGKTTDVKTTTRKDGSLLVGTNKKEDPCDYYVLMIADFPKFTCKGWASKEDIFQDCNRRDLGHGPVYVVNQNKLNV